jgi:hypothetical protein
MAHIGIDIGTIVAAAACSDGIDSVPKAACARLSRWARSLVAIAWAKGLAFVVVGLTHAVTGLPFAHASEQGPTWVVTEVSGTVQHRNPGAPSTTWQQLHEGDVVGADASVRTGRDGRVLLRHPEATMNVVPGSRISLPDAAESTAVYRVFQSSGTLIYTITEDPGDMAGFEVETPYLSAALGDSTVTVTVSAAGDSLFVAEGTVAVEPMLGGGTVAVEPMLGGEATTIAAGKTTHINERLAPTLSTARGDAGSRPGATPHPESGKTSRDVVKNGAAPDAQGDGSEAGDGRATRHAAKASGETGSLSAARRADTVSDGGFGDLGGTVSVDFQIVAPDPSVAGFDTTISSTVNTDLGSTDLGTSADGFDTTISSTVSTDLGGTDLGTTVDSFNGDLVGVSTGLDEGSLGDDLDGFDDDDHGGTRHGDD